MRSTDVHAHSLGHPRSSATTLTTPSSSFTGAFSSSASSSLMSLPHAPPYPSNPPIVRQSSSASSSMCPSSPRRNRSRRVRRHGSGSTPTPQSSRTERAVAALSLALANGAGSVSDYEALRIAQSALGLEDHHQDAGALWSWDRLVPNNSSSRLGKRRLLSMLPVCLRKTLHRHSSPMLNAVMHDIWKE